MENKKVLSFLDYTNENAYKVNKDGNMELLEWSYYPDHYPEKYEMSKGMKFVWVIKHKGEKMAIFSGLISEEKIKNFMEDMKKGELL